MGAAAVWRSLLPWLVAALLAALALWQRALLAAASGLEGDELLAAILVLALGAGALLQLQAARSQRTRATLALREARQAFDESGDVLLLLDAQGRIVDFNARAAQAFGLDRARSDRLSLAQLQASRGSAATRELLDQLGHALAGEEPQFDWRLPQRDGSEQLYEARLRCLERAGLPLLLASLREAGRRQQELQRLADVSQRQASLIDSLPNMPLLVCDSGQRIRLWNQAAAERFGYAADDALGRPLDELLAPAGQQAVLAATLTALLTNPPTTPVAADWRHRHGGQVGVELQCIGLPGGGDGPELALLDRTPLLAGDAQQATVAAAIALELLRGDDGPEAVTQALAGLGAVLGVDVLRLDAFRDEADGVTLRVVPVCGWQRQSELALGADDGGFDAHAQMPTWHRRLQVGVVVRTHAGSDDPAERGLLQRWGMAAALLVPITLDGRCWGYLAALAQSVDPGWRAADERALHVAGTALVAAIERRRSEERLRQHAKVFAATHDAVLVTDLDGSIVAANAAFCRQSGWGETDVLGKTPRLLRSGRHDDSFYAALWSSLREHGHWRGEIWNRHRGGELFPQWLDVSAVLDERGEPTHYVAVGADISQLKRSEQQLEHLAHHDPLTGLPNRLLAGLRLEHALEGADRNVRQVGVIFLDLDGFKRINDSLGHSAGDRLLVAVAERLRHRVRGNDTLARLGGDEFLVIAEDLHHAGDAAGIAQKLVKALEAPFVSDGREVFLGASIGISLYPGNGNDGETLIRNADTAMYQAKASGRNQVCFFTQEMNAQALAQLELDAQLRNALPQGRFELHFQPKYQFAAARIGGVEALLRLRGADDALIAPDRFIPLAERSGMIVAIGAWVLREACLAARRWQDAGHVHVGVAVNVSARQFRQPGFIDDVAEALRRSGLAPAALELELTETVLMDDPPAMVERLRALKQLGVTLALDDFGTGYSSLGYLLRFPIDVLKIDKSFVGTLGRDRHAEKIVVAIIDLARRMNLKVVAEGVESGSQAELLRQRRCDLIQGYLISRPLPEAALLALLAAPPQLATGPLASVELVQGDLLAPP